MEKHIAREGMRRDLAVLLLAGFAAALRTVLMGPDLGSKHCTACAQKYQCPLFVSHLLASVVFPPRHLDCPFSRELL